MFKQSIVINPDQQPHLEAKGVMEVRKPPLQHLIVGQIGLRICMSAKAQSEYPYDQEKPYKGLVQASALTPTEMDYGYSRPAGSQPWGQGWSITSPGVSWREPAAHAQSADGGA